jgi:hypothetical protein
MRRQAECLTRTQDQQQCYSARLAWLHIACKIAIRLRWCDRTPYKLAPAVRRIAGRTNSPLVLPRYNWGSPSFPPSCAHGSCMLECFGGVKERCLRFGPLADVCAAKSDFRFTPQSGHARCIRSCPLWANSGHREQHPRQQKNPAFSPGGSRHIKI